MRIIAGVDEAGLGPTLGPLATASAALFVPDHWREDTPWQELAPGVVRDWTRKDTRLAVADSKVLYRTGGLREFEKTLGAFARAVDGGHAPSFAVADPGAATHPCYCRAVTPVQLPGSSSRRRQSRAPAPSLAPFPVYVGPEELDFAARQLSATLAGSGARAAYLGIDCLFEPALNARFAAGLNKNQALLMETGRHLRRLDKRFPNLPITALVDKQGGRNEYAAFLIDLFPGAWLDTLEAGVERSHYRLRRPGGDFDLIFKPKADAASFPTALASMAAKYARERFMAGLNSWFAELCPELKPTAGYPEDARRWLREVEAEGLSARGEVALLVRER